MAKKIILPILIAFCVNTFSQEYFNEKFEFDYVNVVDGALNAIETQNAYIISGTTSYSESIFWPAVGIAKINLSGKLQLSKKYGDTTSMMYGQNMGALLKVDSTFYQLGNKRSYLSNGEIHDQIMIFNLNDDFDTIWTKSIGEKTAPYDTSFVGRDLIKTNIGFAISGTHQTPIGWYHDAMLIKTDDSGNLMWKKLYGGAVEEFNEGYTVIQTTDGGYAIGAYKWVIGSFGASVGDPVVIKTDSLGNKEWEANLGGPYQDGTALVCLASDGNIMVASRYDVDSVDYDQYYSRVQLTKVDNLGNILWNKLYTDSTRNTSATNIRPDSSGGYIICGSVGENNWPYEPAFMGYMLRIDSVGDSIWYRKYAIATGKDSHNYLYDAIPTSDGGFLGAGYCLPLPPDTGNQDAWVIKVDSLGCVSPWECWVGQREYEWEEAENGKFIKVFPNPAGSWIEVEAGEEGKGESDVEIEVMDMLGRIYESKTIPKPVGKIYFRFDTSNWNRGIYLISLKENGIVLGSRKAILN